ncbi:hypothetical protein R6242_20135 [Iodobacter sp. CM08]|uniref:hypothetical protein n=1 Tax=Iodobacter sp. CM08 TaxID=3085902 RepID=UPI002980C9A8|nr:hypothetical protein [Iodobacter sp. CM08]MDW5418884.1 hypothetical protein [Iodobacter sp. CM08]
MHSEYKEELKRRIKEHGIYSSILMTLIILLSLGFPSIVFIFEVYKTNTPSFIINFNDNAWHVRMEVIKSTDNIRDIIKGPIGNKNEGIESNILSLKEEIKSFSNKIDSFSSEVQKKQVLLQDSHINGQRLLFLFSGLFVLFLIKLLSNLYRHNANIRTHYTSMLDALIITSYGPNEEKFNLEFFQNALKTVTRKDLILGETTNVLEKILTREKVINEKN